MNKRQKIVQQTFLNNEEAIIKRLKQAYNKSLDDITKKAQTLHEEFEDLKAVYDNIEDEEEREILKSRMQSKVYQKKYQESLKKQVSDILDKMHKEEFTNVADYLNKCYEDGFIGTMYDLQGQGIPLCFPLDQEAMVRAVQLDSKISQGLYSRLGEDVGLLKKKITAQVSRGIATGMTFKQVAQQLSAYTKIGYNNAIRIARTEGHRIQCQSAMDTCYKAKEKGADVVKQWDATLDGKTRESHAMVDGEIRELDEKFSNGLMLPGDSSGGAAEVVNCRCALLQRARWAVQGGFTKMNNFTKQLESFEKPEDYAEFKKGFYSKENKKYMNYVQQMEEKYGTKDFQKVLDMMNTREYNHYSKLLANNPMFNKQPKATKVLTNNVKGVKIQAEKVSDDCKKIIDDLKTQGVEYREVKRHDTPLTNDEIINVLSGGDNTSGSCASVGLAYIGQKGGLNVLDFRDGASRRFFATKFNLDAISRLPGIKTITESAKSSVTAGKKLLKQLETSKEYYLVSGKHAAIVRKTDEGILQYLELQSATRSGWTDFNGNPGYTLKSRFGEVKSTFGVDSFMIDVDSFKDSNDLKNLLGYINTAENEQRKGKYGTIK